MKTPTRILLTVLLATVAYAEDHSQIPPNEQNPIQQNPIQQNPIQQNPAPKDIVDIQCEHVSRSFWTKLPGLGRWAKKERKIDQNSHTGFPIQSITVQGSGSNDVITAKFGSEENTRTQSQMTSGDFKLLSDVETSQLKWPKRWWNKLRHIESKTVYSGEWLNPKDTTDKFKQPWTLKLVRTIKSKKKQSVVQIIGVAEIQDENGRQEKVDVTCSGRLPE